MGLHLPPCLFGISGILDSSDGDYVGGCVHWVGNPQGKEEELCFLRTENVSGPCRLCLSQRDFVLLVRVSQTELSGNLQGLAAIHAFLGSRGNSGNA